MNVYKCVCVCVYLFVSQLRANIPARRPHQETGSQEQGCDDDIVVVVIILGQRMSPLVLCGTGLAHIQLFPGLQGHCHVEIQKTRSSQRRQTPARNFFLNDILKYA